jgi:hypothetical protein
VVIANGSTRRDPADPVSIGRLLDQPPGGDSTGAAVSLAILGGGAHRRRAGTGLRAPRLQVTVIEAGRRSSASRSRRRALRSGRTWKADGIMLTIGDPCMAVEQP